MGISGSLTAKSRRFCTVADFGSPLNGVMLAKPFAPSQLVTALAQLLNAASPGRNQGYRIKHTLGRTSDNGNFGGALTPGRRSNSISPSSFPADVGRFDAAAVFLGFHRCKDTTIGGNGGPGIVSASAATAITVLDNVSSQNSAYGIAVANGNRVAINRSNFSGNTTAGVLGDAGSQIIVNDSTISHNGYGVQSSSSVRVSNSEISFNNAAFSGSAGTFGNNRLSGNGAVGTTPMPLGGATTDLGQQ